MYLAMSTSYDTPRYAFFSNIPNSFLFDQNILLSTQFSQAKL
jgi:hypothetical protein